MGVYSIFVDEDDMHLQPTDYDDGMWHMHFDGACSNEGNMKQVLYYTLL
jgi:hypothetical protein